MFEMDSKELALKAARILDEKGANDIVVLNVAHMTSITDYFVIVNGRNVQAVHTLAEDLEDKLSELQIFPRRTEGSRDAKWVVLDYAHVIIHIFHPEERDFYGIERLWNDGTNRVEFVSVEEE